jgi:clan AA aspartic protease (TIGR02281 family)
VRFAVIIVALLMLSALPCLAAADRRAPKKNEPGPYAQLLQDKGLRKQGSTYVLAGELELSKLAREVPALQRAVLDAGKEAARADELETARQDEIAQGTEQQAALAAQIAAATNASLRNNIILQSNALIARLKQLHAATDVEQALVKARERSAAAREAFVDRVLKMRLIADELEKEYRVMAEDAEVTKALSAASSAEEKKLSLGPSGTYKSNVAALKKLEAKVLSESIKLRRERKSFYVNVVVGSKPPREFVVDTGASVVTLPAKMADDLDLTPNSSSPRVRCVLADGREVEGRRVIAKSMRVSSFTVDNVECVVLPPDLTNAPPLLGMTFLSNYNCRINTEAGTMTLTKVEAGGPLAPKAKKTGKSKA